MNILRRIAVAVLLGQAACIHGRAGEVIDRIVASVQRQVILESELRIAMAYQCLAEQTSCNPDDASQRKAALEKLIDQALLEQQMQQSQFTSGAGEETAQEIERLRKQIAGTAGESWTPTLHRYGLTEQELAQQAEHEAAILRFVDSHFRGTLHIEDAAIEDYYHNVLVPQLQATGAPVPALPQVANRIREILAQQEINKELTAWLQILREQGEVRIH